MVRSSGLRGGGVLDKGIVLCVGQVGTYMENWCLCAEGLVMDVLQVVL